MAAAQRPHAVCIPLPGLSHINVMLKVAKLLHFKGFHITFVVTCSNYQKLVAARGGALDLLPDFRFETLPDGKSKADVAVNCVKPGRRLITKLNQSTIHPKVSCIVADLYMSATIRLAEEFGIPEVLLWPCSAAVLLLQLHIPQFFKKGVLKLKDKSFATNGYLDTFIDFIPGVKDVRLKDLPTDFWEGNFHLNGVSYTMQKVYKASAVIINTFDALESEALMNLKSLLKLPLYTVGPLQLLEAQIPNNQLKSFRSNLYKEDQDCIKWLDSKQPNSVIYVNFGSEAGLTPEQLKEFAWGLANSKHHFFWAIRPDLVIGETGALPVGFAEETADRGFISGWCPQEEVLCHPSVGGFLTHSGWNSTMDTICGGVPVISWPVLYDQPTNSRYTCKHWGFGMQLAKDVKRYEVEGLVRELMQGRKGKELKKSVTDFKYEAQESTKPRGFSYMNLDNLVEEVQALKFERRVGWYSFFIEDFLSMGSLFCVSVYLFLLKWRKS